MQDILNIPFLVIYALYKIHCFAIGVAVASGILSAVSIVLLILNTCDPVSEDLSRISSKLLKIAIPTCAIAGFMATICPGDSEFKACTAMHIANGVVNSEIGTKSQEVVVKWLDDKLNEVIKEKE